LDTSNYDHYSSTLPRRRIAWAIRIFPLFISGLWFGGCVREFQEIVETYEDGTPKIILTFRGRKDSLNYHQLVLYPSGKADHAGQIVNGKKSGTWTWWHENGNRKAQCKFEGGRYVDTIFHWYENGQVQQVEVLPASGIRDGECCSGTTTRYWENGKVKEQYMSMNRLLHGTYKRYYENGGWSISTYRNDSLEGPTLQHNVDSSGMVTIVVGQYRQNREVGYWQWFNKDSVLRRSVQFEDGTSPCLIKTYYPNGKTESEGTLINGKYEGYVTYYDDQGNLLGKGYFRNGNPVK